MATRTRGNIIPARQTPPSQLPQTGTNQNPRPHPNPSKITSFAQKQIPTHLKSTKTPTTNVSKQQSKRPTPGDTAHKPTFIRSAFDNPSSPSTTQNTRVSPNPTLRPSTFSSKTAIMQKTVPARKPSSSYTRPMNNVKKRFIYVKKQDIKPSAATTKEPFGSPPQKVEGSNSFDVTKPEQNPKVEESSINEAREEAIQIGISNENKTDVLVQVDPDPISDAHTKEENDKQDIILAVKTEVTEDTSQLVPETVNIVNNINQELSDAHNINEINSSKTHENVADNPTSGVEEMNKEPTKTAVSDKKEAVGTQSEVPETKETEAQEMGRETENVAAKTQVPKAKKESVVSNDVIEETASKLREQRKNKVKALAGAFETVISLREQK